MGTPTRFSLAWGLPLLVLVGSVSIESSFRAWAWFVALTWMGIACCANALRCSRRHCYFTGPFFLLMACLPLLYGFGILEFGPQGWMRLALALVIGTAALWWLPEQIWGRFADGGFTRRKRTRGLR